MGRMLAGLVLAILLAGCGGGGNTATTVTVTRGADGAVQDASSTSSAAPLPPLTPADFAIKVIVLEKKCFGSAGCNLTYTIDPSYVATGPRELTDATVVYNVTGGEQDQVGNMRIDKQGTMHFDRQTRISAEDGAVLTATVTAVIPR